MTLKLPDGLHAVATLREYADGPLKLVVETEFPVFVETTELQLVNEAGKKVSRQKVEDTATFDVLIDTDPLSTK